MTRTLTKNLPSQMGKTITVSGWVHTRRDHGGLIFIDLRDHTGIIQLVVQPEHAEAFGLAEHVRDEFVISATGDVKERGDTLKNPNIPMGDIEVVVTDIRLLNKSEPLPIPVREDAPQASEEHRLKYRYLDLRRNKMQDTLKKTLTLLQVHARLHGRTGIYRGDDPNPCKLQPGRRSRFSRTITRSSRKVLRASASPSTVQTAVDGWWRIAVLSDCDVFS